jgi:hypothetical protein
MRGTRATLTIRADTQFKPVLFVEKSSGIGDKALEEALRAGIGQLQKTYPGIGFQREGNAWQITIPDKYDVGHEAHFAQVTENFLQYLRDGHLPDWEEPCMLTKYFTTIQAGVMSRATRSAQ